MTQCYFSPYLKTNVKQLLCKFCGYSKSAGMLKKNETIDSKGNKVSMKYAPKDGAFSARMLPLFDDAKQD